MAGSAVTFRVFVSSTFSDLSAERNALTATVFPRLREYCARHGCRFQPVDLRWGVRDEAALDQQTMAICLSEIARCQDITPRPNFIVLLGDRYGWCPPAARIDSLEFERLISCVDDESQRDRLTEWYRRDENAVPPCHELRPREGRYVDYDEWAPVERAIVNTLLRAAVRAGLEPLQRAKYEESATAQEVSHGALAKSVDPGSVYCFVTVHGGLGRSDGAERRAK